MARICIRATTIASWLMCWFAGPATAAPPPRVDFGRDVRPILERACWKCHGADKQKGGLRLDRRPATAGDSGDATIHPGRADDSELIHRLETTNTDERMPPKADALSREQIQVLRAWIDQGANWPDTAATTTESRREMVVTADDRRHWSYRPLKPITPPTVKDVARCRTPVDRFILAALESRGIHPNEPATSRTLIRRLYMDLIGLPPTPREVEAFVADKRPEAYEELVDRLLDSPHYGERWGRHWLDLTRYADSDGLETDADRPNAYHYRDFVIRAFNEDLPFQIFVRWQLAGDEFEPDNPQAIAATGFLTTAPNEVLTPKHLEEERLRLRFNELDDTAVTTAATFLGLTLGCARCHDHKFDAIPTRDYYRIQAAFIGTARGEVTLASREAIATYRREEANWAARVQPLQKQHDDWLAEQKKSHTVALRSKKVDALSISAADKTILKNSPDSEAGKRLGRAHAKKLELTDSDFHSVFTPEQRKRWAALKQELDQATRSKPRPAPRALAITEANREPQAAWLLARGDFYAKQEPVQLGFLSVLSGSRSPKDYLASARRDAPAAHSSLQRRAMAEWMTDPEQGAGALLARVLVNRVWQHHFGEGLSRTVNDLGVRADNPSHPELLDWLAHDFVAHGWRIKRLHKLILMCAAYRQDTTFDAARAEVDPENRLLWRRRPLRVESEILRDAVLVVSGTLNTEPFGPAFKPPIPAEAMLARNTKSPYPLDAQDTPATRRRSVYMFHKRVVQHPFMQVFDGPDASTSCGRRSVTTVAPQALALLNDPFLRARASDFAIRLLQAGGSDPAKWIDLGFQHALARRPSDQEMRASLAFLDSQRMSRAKRQTSATTGELQRQALTDFCQGLFSLNEFIYVD